MKKLSEEIAHQHLTRYASLADQEAVSLAHADLLLSKQEVIRALLDEFAFSGKTSLTFCDLEDLKSGQITDDDLMKFQMYATDVLYWAAQISPVLINEKCLTDCEISFHRLNQAAQIRVIQIFAILKRTDKLDFLLTVRDDKSRHNAVVPIQRDGSYYLRSYRDENLFDAVYDASVKAIETIRG